MPLTAWAIDRHGVEDAPHRRSRAVLSNQGLYLEAPSLRASRAGNVNGGGVLRQPPEGDGACFRHGENVKRTRGAVESVRSSAGSA